MNHWYDREGNARHTVPTKKGAKNPFRPTTIADARFHRLLPSITTIMSVVDNPALNRWKMGKVAEWCFQAPPGPEETKEEYALSAVEKAMQEVGDAADLGSWTHANIEAHSKGKPMPHQGHPFDLAWAGLLAFQKAGFEVEKSEITVTCPEHGFAGTTDCAVKRGSKCGIVDFKTIRTKPGQPIAHRFGHIPQIAAYHTAFWCAGGKIGPNAFGANIYISTTEPGRVEVVEYDVAQLRDGFECFLSAAHIWRYINKYDPRQKNTYVDPDDQEEDEE